MSTPAPDEEPSRQEAPLPPRPADLARPWRSALWSGLLSLIFPGLGQIRAGAWSLGVMLLGATAALGVMLQCLTWFRPKPLAVAISATLGATYIVVAIAVAADAVRRKRRTTTASRQGWLRSTWLAFIVVLIVNGTFAVLVPGRWQTFSIPAGSMVPTLLVGDYLVAGDLSAGSMPARGDVMIFKYPRDNTTNYVKRIVGLPGDRIQLRQGQLYINGQLCPRRPEDDYVVDDDDGIHTVRRRYVETLPNGVRHDIIKATDEGEMNNTPEYLVPPEHVFVLGDNRDNSLDSRFMNIVGFVPLNNVFAKAGTIYWSHQLARIGSEVK